LPEAIVPKVGHGHKWDKTDLIALLFLWVFLFRLCFIAHSYEANGRMDMEVLACFRPGFLHDANTSIDMEVKMQVNPTTLDFAFQQLS